jgi:hypothetical protein
LSRAHRAPSEAVRCVCAAAWAAWAAWALAPPQPASAFEGDPTLRLKLEGGYDCVTYDPLTLGLTAETPPQEGAQRARTHGAYALAEVSYALTPSWVLQGGYWEGRYTGGRARHKAVVGARYQLDIFHYIPWLGAQLSYDVGRAGWVLPLPPAEEGAPSPGAIDAAGPRLQWGLELGVDRRLSPAHSVSLTLRWLNAAATPPAGVAVGVSWTYHWLLFDPFEA